MYPVQMPSLMYLIFAKQQRIKFFEKSGGQDGQKNFHPDRIRFCKSLSPLFLGLSAKPIPAEMAYPDFILNYLAHFYVVVFFHVTSSYFLIKF